MMYISGRWIGVRASDLRDRGHMKSKFKPVDSHLCSLKRSCRICVIYERRLVLWRTKFRHKFINWPIKYR